MLETSSAPSLRRPIASAAGGLLGAAPCAKAGLAMPPNSGVAARLPADSSKERRPILYLRSVAMSDCPYISVVSRLGDLDAVVVEGDAVGLRSAAHAGVERVDRGDLLAGEREVEHVEVFGDAGGLGGLRDRGAALLQVPAQHHLRGRLAVLAGDLTERRVVERALLAAPVGRDAADGRPGLGHDAVLRVHTLQRGLLEVRMDLDLVHGGHDRC